MGVVSPFGGDLGAFWKDLTSGRVATGVVARFDTTRFPTHRAAEVPGFPAASEAAAGEPRALRYAQHAMDMALRDCGLQDPEALSGTGLVLGTVLGLRPHLEEVRRAKRAAAWADEPAVGRDWTDPGQLLAEPMRRCGLGGPSALVSTGCAAGNTALGLAADWIRAGRADCVLAGGVDELSEAVFQLFTTLRALAGEQVRPFDARRDGMMPGEGAAVLVLESQEHARRRGAPILGEILGHATTADGHHMTAPHPAGDGLRRCMRESLDQAGLHPADIDYVSAHGTGTPANDGLEATCLREFFAGRLAGPAVSSIKGMLGHAQGAASAMEAVACICALGDQRVPGNPTLGEVSPDCAGLDFVREPSREMPVRVAMSNAFGFGGANSTVIFARYAS